ncbi:MAG: hypothetical protein Q8N05_08185 [Bacteroidota bacterium]|nr:hypothetical protein [Bacteroidota bacterium]
MSSTIKKHLSALQLNLNTSFLRIDIGGIVHQFTIQEDLSKSKE